MTKKLTLIIVREGNRVLLGMKKRGFGAGKWNGFGGKIEEGETPEDGAHRELREECGISASALAYRGVLRFMFGGDPVPQEVHLFFADAYEGEPSESEEMRPQWFAIDDIPFHEMWPDDRHWLPLLLEGKTVEGHFWFAGEEIVKYWLETLEHV